MAAASVLAACATGSPASEAAPRFTAAGFPIEDGEIYDAHGYPVDDRMCGMWDGVVECRPTTRRQQLAVFPDHPERFLDGGPVSVGPLTVTPPSGARVVNACIGALTDEMWATSQELDQPAECFWVAAPALEAVIIDFSAQIEAAGFTADPSETPNLQAINPRQSFSRGCERAWVSLLFADQLFNRPREPHVHVVIAFDRLLCAMTPPGAGHSPTPG